MKQPNDMSDKELKASVLLHAAEVAKRKAHEVGAARDGAGSDDEDDDEDEDQERDDGMVDNVLLPLPPPTVTFNDYAGQRDIIPHSFDGPPGSQVASGSGGKRAGRGREPEDEQEAYWVPKKRKPAKVTEDDDGARLGFTAFGSSATDAAERDEENARRIGLDPYRNDSLARNADIGEGYVDAWSAASERPARRLTANTAPVDKDDYLPLPVLTF